MVVKCEAQTTIDQVVQNAINTAINDADKRTDSLLQLQVVKNAIIIAQLNGRSDSIVAGTITKAVTGLTIFVDRLTKAKTLNAKPSVIPTVDLAPSNTKNDALTMWKNSLKVSTKNIISQ